MTIIAGADRVVLADYAAVVNNFRFLVDALTEEAGGGVTWIMDDLQVGGSARTGVARLEETEEAIAKAAQIVESYASIGRALQEGAVLPLKERVARPIDALKTVLPRVESLRFETPEEESTITAAEQAQLVKLYPRRKPSPGAVTGQIETLSRRRHLKFILYDRSTDRPVSCYMNPGQEEMLRNLWGRLVAVEGIVSRDPIEGRPTSIRQITEVVPREEFAPGSWRQALGVLPLGGERPEDVIRRIRNA